ncbi:hypothetical protein B0H15DRAFT_860183 [Mycena belliarum]|uniref:Extracellular conserved serine-rich protein n=1 Tax=Mycena belliarum TaxID=1033014 RepID=A0AAD6TW97_9AGAR|nr:hypothetical protein B0H15DRAFT_860183 [Mycena belliae]
MFGMFKLCAILALAAPFASALQIQSITGNVVSEGTITVSWSTSNSDASGTFSVELNHPSFHDALALANNVDSSNLSKDLPLPNVPAADGYTITFVDISNINAIFATSAPFSIGAVSATQSTTIRGSTLASSKSASSSAGSSRSSQVAISTKPLPSNTGFGVTNSASSTASTSASATSATGRSGAVRTMGGSLAAAIVVGIAAGVLAL